MADVWDGARVWGIGYTGNLQCRLPFIMQNRIGSKQLPSRDKRKHLHNSVQPCLFCFIVLKIKEGEIDGFKWKLQWQCVQ